MWIFLHWRPEIIHEAALFANVSTSRCSIWSFICLINSGASWVCPPVCCESVRGRYLTTDTQMSDCPSPRCVYSDSESVLCIPWWGNQAKDTSKSICVLRRHTCWRHVSPDFTPGLVWIMLSRQSIHALWRNYVRVRSADVVISRRIIKLFFLKKTKTPKLQF